MPALLNGQKKGIALVTGRIFVVLHDSRVRDGAHATSTLGSSWHDTINHGTTDLFTHTYKSVQIFGTTVNMRCRTSSPIRSPGVTIAESQECGRRFDSVRVYYACENSTTHNTAGSITRPPPGIKNDPFSCHCQIHYAVYRADC